MNDQNELYDAVARRADGEEVRLTAAQRETYADFRLNEREIGPLMDVPVRTAALDRARRRAVAALSHPRRSTWPRRAGFVAAAGCAAAIVLAVLLRPEAPHRGAAGPENAVADIPEEVLLDALDPYGEDVAAEVLAQEVEDLQRQFAAGDVPPVPADPFDLQAEELRRRMDDFWLEEDAFDTAYPAEG